MTNDTELVKDNILGDILVMKDAVLGPYIKDNGVWDDIEVQWIFQNINEGDICINVGANIGYHSMMLSKAVGDRGRVYAYEPSSKVFPVLKKNIELQKIKNVYAIKKAVGKESGTVDLYINYFNNGDNRCFNPKELVDDYGNFANHGFSEEIDIETVEITTLDEDIPDSHIDLIFIDAQGLDVDVVIGAKKIIQRYRPKIVLEFLPAWFDYLGVNYRLELNSLINNHNYKMYAVCGANIIQVDCVEDAEKIIENSNGTIYYLNLIMIA